MAKKRTGLQSKVSHIFAGLPIPRKSQTRSKDKKTDSDNLINPPVPEQVELEQTEPEVNLEQVEIEQLTPQEEPVDEKVEKESYLEEQSVDHLSKQEQFVIEEPQIEQVLSEDSEATEAEKHKQDTELSEASVESQSTLGYSQEQLEEELEKEEFIIEPDEPETLPQSLTQKEKTGFSEQMDQVEEVSISEETNQEPETTDISISEEPSQPERIEQKSEETPSIEEEQARPDEIPDMAIPVEIPEVLEKTIKELPSVVPIKAEVPKKTVVEIPRKVSVRPKREKVKVRAKERSKRQTTMIVLVIALSILLFFLVYPFDGSSISNNSIDTSMSPAIQTSVNSQSQPVEIDWATPPVYPDNIRDPMRLGSQQELYNQTSSFIVKGISYIEGQPLATIGTEIVGENEEIFGAKVIKITEDSVEFERDGERWIQLVGE